jgi:hypothetical protein
MMRDHINKCKSFPNGHKCPFGCNGYYMHVAAVAAGQRPRQRFYFYSGVGIFNWYYLSSPSQIPRVLHTVNTKFRTHTRAPQSQNELCE